MNSWYYVVGVANTTNLLLYINGMLNSTTTLNYSNIVQPTVAPRIGNNPDYLANHQDWNGSIDDVMIFNRSLSADEILGLYNATAINHNSTFDERNYTFTAYSQDRSGNVNSSTVIFGIDLNDTVEGCGNLTEENMTYRLTQGVSSSGNCFTVKAKNVTLDCQGNWINGTATANQRAIQNLGYDSMTVKNCRIRDFGTTTDPVGSCPFLYVLTDEGYKLEDDLFNQGMLGVFNSLG